MQGGRLLTEKDMEGSEHKWSCMNGFDKLVEVCRVAAELYDDEKKQDSVTSFDICCSVPEAVYDKSWGKRPVSDPTHDQESDRAPVFSSKTCRISGEELFKWGRNKSMRETSSSSRYYEFGNVRGSPSDHDQLVEEKVLGKNNKKYYGEEDFEYYEKKDKVLGKKRKYSDSKDEDFEYSQKKEKKPRNNVKARNYRVVETAPLPVEFANEIQRLGGNDIRLLIQKKLTTTDLNPKETRFSIPYNQATEEVKYFLTEAEKKTLNKRYADKRKLEHIQVPLLEPNLNRSCIKFKKWDVNTSFWYILCGPNWTVVKRNNHLQAHTDIQVWSFRVNGELNLALVKVPRDIMQI